MGKKIFVIEDDAFILATILAKLNLAGWSVGVENGLSPENKVLDNLRKFSPDFLILDLNLPQIDGLSVCRAMRAEEELMDTEVLVYTSANDQESRQSAERAGARHYYLKNELNVNEFLARLFKIVENKYS